MRHVLLAAVALLALVAAASPAEDEASIALNFQDVELPVLAKFVSEVTGRNFILDDRVRGTVTIMSPTRITPEEAYLVFQSVLQVKGFTTVPSGRFVKIVPARDARETTAPSEVGRSEEVVTRLLPLRYAQATDLVPVLQPLISKDGLLTAYSPTNRLVVIDAGANVARLGELLRELDTPGNARVVEVVPLRFAAAEELAARVREALVATGAEGGGGLRAVADTRTNALVLTGAPDEVRRARAVAARLDQAAPPGTAGVHVYRLKFADAESLMRVLSGLLGLPVGPLPEPPPRGSSFMRGAARARLAATGYDGGMGEPPPAPAPASVEATPATAAALPLEAPLRITADRATNALVVSATGGDWETLRRVIAELDVRRRQVFVEAIVLEATMEQTRALGLEFQAAGDLDGGRGLAQLNLGTLAGAAADPLSLSGLVLAAASNETVRLPDGRQVPAHTVLLTALETNSDINVLSAPNIVTTDNEEAEIVVGKNVPFVASRATSASNLSNLFTTIERHDVGITLRMTPQITADDFVRLTIFEEVSDIDPTAEAGDPTLVGPTTTIRSASTAVAARDGQTVVIGGLLADGTRTGVRSVPYLGKVPVLGALFRRDDTRRVKTNLLVFLTPHIIASDTQMVENSLRERRRMQRALPPGVPQTGVLTGPSWHGSSAPVEREPTR
jgi:general secretion pathway protein D